ncbi:MAG: permease [Microbacter sp.]
MNNKKIISLVLSAIIGWFVVYHFLQPMTDWVVDTLLGMTKGAKLTETIRFFIFEYPKVMLLLLLIIFFVGIIRTFFTPERTRKALEGRRTFTGNVMASMLGIVTPFCSCSAIPLFLGFVETGVPLGVTFSFLIASPMINEVAVILLYGLFGLKTALIYISTGLAIAMIAGYIIGILKLEKWVEPWVFEVHSEQQTTEEQKISLALRVQIGWGAVKEIVGKVWLYVAVGIAIGAGAHGYVPQGFMVSLMGNSTWYSVPLSVLIGIPLYSNAAGIVPIVSVLIEKGAALGTSLAFMMSVIALSLPEMIILRKVLKLPLIVTFIGVVGVGIMIVGYLFNWIF